MSIARQLYQLQEVELEIESNERALDQMTGQLGESPAVSKARVELATEQKRLEELGHQQRALEWEIEGIAGKLGTAEETLYSGRVKNPKELSNLQHEVEIFKTNRSVLEDKLLNIMEQVEATAGKVAALSADFKKLEAEGRGQQRQLQSEIDGLKVKLVEEKDKQRLMISVISAETVEFYRRLREQKGTAVAVVEQGRCRGCRILLATTELQRARNGLVQCSSCGRILFVA